MGILIEFPLLAAPRSQLLFPDLLRHPKSTAHLLNPSFADNKCPQCQSGPSRWARPVSSLCSGFGDLSTPCRSLMLFKRFLKHTLSSFYLLSSAGESSVAERFLSPLFLLGEKILALVFLDCMHILKHVKGASLFLW